jgi:hypothetical protein
VFAGVLELPPLDDEEAGFELDEQAEAARAMAATPTTHPDRFLPCGDTFPSSAFRPTRDLCHAVGVTGGPERITEDILRIVII